MTPYAFAVHFAFTYTLAVEFSFFVYTWPLYFSLFSYSPIFFPVNKIKIKSSEHTYVCNDERTVVCCVNANRGEQLEIATHVECMPIQVPWSQVLRSTEYSIPIVWDCDGGQNLR